MSAKAASPLGIFLFLTGCTLKNSLLRRVRRLREVRYIVGLAFGLLYVSSILFSPRGHARRQGSPSATVAEFRSLLLMAGAYGMAVLLALSWLFRKGRAALNLTEADTQFLFPAPLPRRAVLHYALLKTQLAMLGSALVMAVIFRRGGGASAWERAIGFWVFLSTLQFHEQALAFTKARWGERPRGRLMKAAAAVLAAALLGALLVFGFDAGQIAVKGLAGGKFLSIAAFEAALGASRWGRIAFLVLAPFRAVLLPTAPDGSAGFLASLPAALGILTLHYLWLARTAVRYEEATLDEAARRAHVRAERQAGRLGTRLPSTGTRLAVPFALDPVGRPEVAIVWKALLSWRRVRLRSFAGWVLFGSALAFFLSAWSVATFPVARAAAGPVVLSLALLTVLVSQMIPVALRVDFRADLEHAAALRVLPLSPERLVAGELTGPWVVTTLHFWSGLLLAAALSLGLTWGAGLPAGNRLAPFLEIGGFFPLAAGAALFIPSLFALSFVVQNAAVLALPGWFPPGRRKASGLEASGAQMLGFIGTSLVTLVALIPPAIVALPVAWLLRGPLGLWVVPAAGLAASVVLMAEVAGGVVLLAALWERFDPALDLNA